MWFERRTAVRKQKCPKCRMKTKRVHGYRWQSIQGSHVGNQPVTLYLRKRRYRCTGCGHAFFERLLVDRYQRQTSMLTEDALLFTADLSFTQAGKHLGLSVHRMIRLLDQRQVEGRTVLPRAIAIDEFKGDADGERFQTVVVDAESREILNILPDRRRETIFSYLKSCDTSRLQMVVMDLSRGFKKAVREEHWAILLSSRTAFIICGRCTGRLMRSG
ncbi:transposase, partial [Salibacterium salarium]